MPSPKAIISGGGTGGHVFPAIAIAKALQAMQPEIDILFVGAEGRMEMEKVPAAGYPIEGLWISGLQRKITLQNLAFPFKVISSLYRSRKIIHRFKPDIAIGVGGYASGPLLRIAQSLKVKTVIQEQNSFPGITNKWLAPKVDKICVAYEGLEKWFPEEKIVLTGNPVREEVTQIEGKKQRGLQMFGLDESKPVVLAIGGSLGARTINESLVGLIDTFRQDGIQLIWQTGKSFYEKGRDLATESQYEGLSVQPFINTMDLAYAAADVIISRAGAMSLSELSLVGKPCILIPSPNVSEDHQTHNAMALVQKNAALIVKDSESRDKLGPVLFDLLQNMEQQKELSTNIQKLAMRNSAGKIARIISDLAQWEK